MARAGAALLLANVRFWPTVAPLVARELARWERRAREIESRPLRELALAKLREEHFNSQFAATLATLAPRARRPGVVEAIVAYEVMYDYLDGLTEQPSEDPLGEGRELYRAFTDAIRLGEAPTGGYYSPSHGARDDVRDEGSGRERDDEGGDHDDGHDKDRGREHEHRDDNGYLEELVRVVRGALAQLPSAQAISEVALGAATRCAQAQIRAHAATRLGTEQLEAWATREAARTPLGWQEFLAGAASSVLAVHALIAAAADPRTTAAQAAEIDTVYLSICALSTMLDSLVDYDRDLRAGEPGYIRYYPDHGLLARDLVRAAQRAAQHSSCLRDGPHHLMTLAGVVAYYSSAPTADSPLARPVTRRIRRELEPLITPTFAVMRTWRTAKRLRARWQSRALRRHR
jgi:tetraprenyl-beta-curcumene synthase